MIKMLRSTQSLNLISKMKISNDVTKSCLDFSRQPQNAISFKLQIKRQKSRTKNHLQYLLEFITPKNAMGRFHD